ncbi:glutaredoxin family protein [Vibrio mangrovi]|uniref:Glutaredoxin family protein n=1 Tax=Vibrio mangrovi TaxID=474394 RepID=A0A1Y6INN9_9VIBR|nr:glutaredoxin family protein [Vibrio mangrovi]MDW6003940.1 glutaredoxin family protein [Vibrio mangrovi]SMR99266.1 hypothetical protein VIM7927_00491 [Vibrio mangrovi]
MLILYGTQYCHLCEQAFALAVEAGVAELVQQIDIAGDKTLYDRYGVTIPVFRFQDQELNWPFSLTELKIWLEAHGINKYS